LHSGLLGISFQGENDYTDEPVVAVVRINSPAEKAGLKVGDRITGVKGEPVARLGQLRHALGRLYAGDSVDLQIRRGEESLTLTAQLTDRLLPFAHPFLGILPRRDMPEAGIVVRYVYPDSPAAAAGILAGDRLAKINGTDVTDVNGAQEQLAQLLPETATSVSVVRGNETLNLEITLAHLPESVPADLPAAREPSTPAGERPAVGRVEIKVPEEPNACWAYVPDNYDPNMAYGLLVWLHPNGEYDIDGLIEEWRTTCAERDLVLLAPRADDAGWRPTDLDFVRKTIDQVSTVYRIDRQRIVVGGRQVGGAMAYLAAFSHRDLVRGAAVVDAALPAQVAIPENEPLRRLAVFSTLAQHSRLASAVQEGVARLREQRFPVTVREQPAAASTWDDDERAALARWMDSLDRL
jgi:serine protease Do